MAASLGKKDLVELLLSQVKEASEYLKRSDFFVVAVDDHGIMKEFVFSSPSLSH